MAVPAEVAELTERFEELVGAVHKELAERQRAEEMARAAELEAKTTAEAYRLLFDNYLELLRGDDERLGCPFQKMAAEYSNRDGAVRDRLVESMRDWRDQVGRVVVAAVASGFLRPDLDVPMFVHEFAGIAMVFQQSCRLMRDPKAEQRARKVFEALLQRSRREPAAS